MTIRELHTALQAERDRTLAEVGQFYAGHLAAYENLIKKGLGETVVPDESETASEVSNDTAAPPAPAAAAPPAPAAAVLAA